MPQNFSPPSFWFILLIGIIISLSTPFLQADTKNAIPLNLTETLRLAKERHVEVIVSHERVHQAISRIAQARSSLLPQLNGTASQVRQTVNLNAFGIFVPLPGFDPLVGPFNTLDARIALTQAIFDMEAIQRLRSARVGKLLSLADAKKTEQDVLALVATLYLNARRAGEVTLLSRALLRQAEARLNIARSRFQLGLGTSLEVTEREADLAEARSALTQSQTTAMEQRLDLSAALGLPNETPIQFDSEEKIAPLSLPKEDLAPTVTSHPDVELARKNVEVNRLEKKVAQAAYFPKILGTANYGLSGQDPTNADDTYSYGGQLSIPLYQGGLREARIREVKSQIKESEARLKDTQIHTESKILSAQESLKRAFSLMKAAQADWVAAQRQLTIAREQLRNGLGTDLNVVEMESQVAQARDKKNEARSTYDLSKVNLAHAMGRMEDLMANGR